MATVTEKDIIGHLKEKIRFHQQEAKKIENLLTAFTGNSIIKDEQASVPAQKARPAIQAKGNAGAAATTKRNAGKQALTNAPAVSNDKASSQAEVATSGSKAPKSKTAGSAANALATEDKIAEPANAEASSPDSLQEDKAEIGLKTVPAAAPVKNKGKQAKPATNGAAQKGPKANQQGKAEAKAGTTSPSQTGKSLEIPSEYSDKMTINAKIAYALNEIGEGFNEDIANAMAQYEPQSDAKKLGKQISGILSTLKNKGLLTATREGRKDKYALAK